MITIFAVPKAFKGHFGMIQENAIASWTKINPRPEIILFGNEKGTTQICKKYSLKQISNIRKNRYGTPILSDVFKKAKKKAANKILAYVNADIILPTNFCEKTGKVKLKKFLLVGNRWDLKITKPIDFTKDWEKGLLKTVRNKKMGPFQPLDYFVFPRNISFAMPPFAVGRTIWDNWIIFRAKRLRVPVIDASLQINAFHESHDYSHAGGYKSVWFGCERQNNLKLAGYLSCPFNLFNSDFILSENGTKRPLFQIYREWRRFQSFPVINPEYKFLMPLVSSVEFLIKVYKKGVSTF